MRWLNSDLVRRIRQHHAIEHATLTLLMRRNPLLQLVGGRSNHRGFYVYGAVDTTALQSAAQEALQRLSNGEAELAIHPHCGTNLVVAGVLAGLATLATAAIGHQRKVRLVDQAPAAMLAATGALLASRPLGTLLQQRVTTLADVRQLRLGAVKRRQIGRWIMHFVNIEAEEPADRHSKT